MCLQAKIWLKMLRETWYHCFKHTLRASNVRDNQGVSGWPIAGLFLLGMRPQTRSNAGASPCHGTLSSRACSLQPPPPHA